MPVWHAATKAARDKGDLVLIGVIQEQHAERCRLFAQWKQFDWPIGHDPINKMNLTGVPLVVDVDERGITTSLNPDVKSLLASLAEGNQPTQASSSIPTKPNLQEMEELAEREHSYEAWRNMADALILWGDGESSIRRAVDAYHKAQQILPRRADTYFRLGVAHRMLFDLPSSAAGSEHDLTPTPSPVNHFQLAATFWGKALQLNPNHYIYRRRIQQYGPRLTKPYPFYGWIEQARQEILARGEVPMRLIVEPSGAELASPTPEIAEAPAERNAPDPAGRINRDALGLVQTDVVMVPAAIHPGETVRVHVTFTPRRGTYWNNENDPLLLWVELPAGWNADRQWLETPSVAAPESSERRALEFELTVPGTQTGPANLKAYALYYVCESRRGACLYLRQDIDLTVNIAPR